MSNDLHQQLANAIVASIASYLVGAYHIFKAYDGRDPADGELDETAQNLKSLSNKMAAWSQWLRGPECDLDTQLRADLQAVSDCLVASTVAASRIETGFTTWLTSEDQINELITPGAKEWIEQNMDPSLPGKIKTMVEDA